MVDYIIKLIWYSTYKVYLVMLRAFPPSRPVVLQKEDFVVGAVQVDRTRDGPARGMRGRVTVTKARARIERLG